MIYAVILLNVCLLVFGQVCFKWGIAQSGGFSLSHLAALLANGWTILGLSLYVVATLVWFYVLSRVPLSLAYPLQSVSYAFGLFVSRYVLHESVPWTRWVGVLVILLGVTLVAYTPRMPE
ncbi:putative 4-amino-4-deoxy-L-arabinose-phosphoundecaprenol flippase subunit ArnE [Alicyclobacillus cellulosilyticus]|uniref:4-amino-4-deoxy-L-arabinose-phosphoundecaprenol flippase subunit ArnE n=1 Tax=Alicyclobacillus cellulosilyticus TaxID=1003997 RepID=A0A917NLN7_9BACL|nr:EamA family transporter [Alicyclobacillus cellulosilyticus]GGJ09958.1 putative 4-amino-4-deoxy-L-arabinose-phosphoundecaprenol flippase subunit ArnE [Alicyclobacillus cellulosilyticus]